MFLTVDGGCNNKNIGLGVISKSSYGVFEARADTQRKYAEFAGRGCREGGRQYMPNLGDAGRSSYIGELKRSAAVLDRLSLVLKPDEESLRAAAEQVIQFVNAHTLTSDLSPAIARLSATGEFRASHCMPITDVS
jgi:hypothetical protein